MIDNRTSGEASSRVLKVRLTTCPRPDCCTTELPTKTVVPLFPSIHRVEQVCQKTDDALTAMWTASAQSSSTQPNNLASKCRGNQATPQSEKSLTTQKITATSWAMVRTLNPNQPILKKRIRWLWLNSIRWSHRACYVNRYFMHRFGFLQPKRCRKLRLTNRSHTHHPAKMAGP